MDKEKVGLSIVIPCFNEAENIPLLIKSINNVYKPDTEIILVDNGSIDDTSDVLSKELDEKVAMLHLDHLGVKLTKMSDDQSEYTGIPKKGPFKTKNYRY